jgi:PhzF family phenazine biosynthesis protein
LEAWLDDHTLQSINAENVLSETAFFVKKNDHYEFRWFSPKIEVDLCGNATLASAFVIFNYIDQAVQSVSFKAKKSGML